VNPGGRALIGARWASPQLDWLPRALTEPQSFARSVAIGWLTAFPPSIALAMLINLVAPNAEPPKFEVSGGLAIFGLVVFSPVVETLIMGGVLALLLRVLPARWAVVLSALGWGAVHSLAAPIWGLIIWWPFLVFSALYVTWRQRSQWLALGVPMLVHALQNLPPALIIAYGSPI
jgi:hypothetical protein